MYEVESMKRIIDVDMEFRCKKLSTSLDRFLKKYPNLIYWKEQLEYMEKNNIDFDSDKTLAERTKNDSWCWALHLDIEENYFYIAVIERA